jgi:23S rRNA (adenine2503-C2)-methyltransferase
MLELVLIAGVNDSDEDASMLAEFAQSIMRDVEGAKVVVNLIPFNDIGDIGHHSHRTPSKERVLEFQRKVIQQTNENDATVRSVLCYIRTTRGDDESSACGQLATKRKQKP